MNDRESMNWGVEFRRKSVTGSDEEREKEKACIG
jgi:hypothetical protein